MADRQPARRRELGAWYTPASLVARMVDAALADFDVAGPLKALDPACGDGRLLSALCDRVTVSTALGVDIDPTAIAAIGDQRLDVRCGNGLDIQWSSAHAGGPFDLVLANPPFLSQMARSTTRGGSSQLGGGPYANTAMEFCLTGVRALRPGGRLVILLPQSALTARDGADLRAAVAAEASMIGSWWSPDRPFEAEVNVAMLVLQRRVAPVDGASIPWSSVVTRVLGIPDLPTMRAHGVIGDRSAASANFRDEYYALVPAVDDAADGPPLITSGLIDPGRCAWGTRPVRFAKRRFEHPRVDLDQLEGRFAQWAKRLLVPKVLVAAQTRIVEAVADVDGAWLPAVPVISVVPHDSSLIMEVAAVLTSPIASLSAWHSMAGSGLSPTSVRLSPATVMAMPWPHGPLTTAVAALQHGDLVGCGRAVLAAFDVVGETAEDLIEWWVATGRSW